MKSAHGRDALFAFPTKYVIIYLYISFCIRFWRDGLRPCAAPFSMQRSLNFLPLKISPEIFNGRKFSGTFSGLVNNDTLLTVDMDEDFSLFVTSNIDNFDY